MGMHDIFESIADDREAEGPFRAAIQAAMAAASPFYAAGAYLNRAMHDIGVGDRKALSATVLSVGNITLGGTGKTPFTIWLCEWLRQQGKRPAILTRGYGRADEDRLVLVHDGRRLRANTHDAGDEPVLLAESLGDVPVAACADRHRAGTAVLRKLSVDTIVLDDGFQHHRLARQGDIVLVDAGTPLSNLRLFPRGSLREAPSTLGRAHLIVMTRFNQARDPKIVYREIRRAAPSVPVVRMNLETEGAFNLQTGEGLGTLRGKNVILFSAVANPESVRQSARELGVRIRRVVKLPDHGRLDRRRLESLERQRVRAKADLILTTEKDAVKIREIGEIPASMAAIRVRLSMVVERDAALAGKVLKARLEARLVRGYLR